LDKNIEVRIVIRLLKVGLNLGEKFMGGSAAAFFALGNKVLAKNGPVAVDNDIGKLRRLLSKEAL
jgi:hypothetical protein